MEGGWAELPDELVEKVLERLGGVNPRMKDWGSFGPPPRCGWCALRGRPCTMRW